MNRRPRRTALFAMGMVLALMAQGTAQQVPLPGNQIPQFVDALPVLGAGGITPKIDDGSLFEIHMREFNAQVLPAANYGPTRVWGYILGTSVPTSTLPTYIGPVIVAKRGTSTKIKFVNELPATNVSALTAWLTATDQTLHWADPLGTGPSLFNYGWNGSVRTNAPVPAVPHLHGGEVPPQLDGGPDAWFTGDGIHVGHAFYSKGWNGTAQNFVVYEYPNTQEAADIWFHDHALGITRLNVYAGLAGAYVLTDPGLTLPDGLTATGIDRDPANSGGEELMIPLVIQDRMFDINGQLFFPNAGINPEHPFWIPEFTGDTIVVNGKSWPYLNVERKRYRFLFLNGSNARTYELFLADPVTKVLGPPMWVIGTDGGYLDTPVKIDPNVPPNDKLVMMPGERYDVIIDFADPAWLASNPTFSGTLILRNTGATPYPKGPPPNGVTLGRILQLRVTAPTTADNSYNPASGTPLRPAMVRLVDPAKGTPLVTFQVRRQLTLNEFMGPGGPLEVLVNNTRWGGKSVHKQAPFTAQGVRPDFTPVMNSDGSTTYYSELPKEGQTELWEIINLTADAHPIHLHLVQFQLMNRQKINLNKYQRTYDALFPASNAVNPLTAQPYPGGVFIGGYGPPLPCTTPNADLAVGGNPAITPFLQGLVLPPAPREAGWKDTVTMLPGQVTRIMVRWAPTDVAATTTPADAYFPFDPNGGHGYVWHCHIVDHEDNEMMRPDIVVPNTNPSVTRTLTKGVNY